MPVEIRELQITAVVEDSKSKAQPSQPQGSDKDKIIAECVEQVLQVLKQKNER